MGAIDTLADIASSDEVLGCYSELFESRASVLAPKNVAELKRIFAHARASGRRVTFRAGGHSLDGQALGDDLVVSMLSFNSIAVDIEAGTLRVGPGARWGTILAKLERHGLVPAVTVTTEHATAGGTLSGDCLSRFSPAYGKEGKWITSFDLLTTEGQLLTCRPPPAGTAATDWTLEERAFTGVISGLGYLGAVVVISYRLLRVGETDGRIGVRSIVRKYRSYDRLAKDLVPAARKTHDEESDPLDPTKLDGIYSAVHTSDAGEATALLITSAFTTTRDRKRMPLHQPGLAVRPLAECLMRSPRLSEALWPLFFRFAYSDGEEFIDDLAGYTFFMDGNVRAKELAKSLGFSFKAVQQTFIVPSEAGSDAGWDRAKDDLVEWLEYAHAALLAANERPTLQDVLFLPRDDRFLLSATADLAGFAVTYSFETSNPARLKRIRAILTELTDALWDKFQGRVYLVKNVCARPETLLKMYGHNAIAFSSLKQSLDPSGILRNAFLERTFGGILGPP